jgi:hypothetical protein
MSITALLSKNSLVFVVESVPEMQHLAEGHYICCMYVNPIISHRVSSYNLYVFFFVEFQSEFNMD